MGPGWAWFAGGGWLWWFPPPGAPGGSRVWEGEPWWVETVGVRRFGGAVGVGELGGAVGQQLESPTGVRVEFVVMAPAEQQPVSH